METGTAVSTKAVGRRLCGIWLQIVQANQKSMCDSGDVEETSGRHKETC